MIRGRFSRGRASSRSPTTEDTAVVAVDCPPTKPEAASAVVLLPTKSLTERSSRRNRRPSSIVPGFVEGFGRVRLDKVPPRFLSPNNPCAEQFSQNTTSSINTAKDRNNAAAQPNGERVHGIMFFAAGMFSEWEWAPIDGSTTLPATSLLLNKETVEVLLWNVAWADADVIKVLTTASAGMVVLMA